jgi:putative hemolysin
VSLTVELILILILLVANGILAASEMAIISSRRSRLESDAEQGDTRSKMVLDLIEDPGSFLSAVQIGITLVGTIAGTLSGATLVERLTPAIGRLPFSGIDRYAHPVAFTFVVIAISYASVVIGELVPKRIALASPERLARRVAPTMRSLTSLAGPVVSLLTRSSDRLVNLLGQGAQEPLPASEEEIKYLISEGTKAGAFAGTERELVERVFQFADRRVGELMTPRSEIVAINIKMPARDVYELIRSSNNSRFPVYQENLDHILGIVHAKDVLLQGEKLDMTSALRQPAYVPESQLISTTLRFFQTTHSHMAIVLNEYGGTEGLVTMEDVLEQLVGEIRDEHDAAEQPVVRREDGSLLADGLYPVDELRELLGVEKLPSEEEYQFNTLAGFVISQLGRLPRVADHITALDKCFEVVDMDGRRVDRVLISDVCKPGDQRAPDEEPDQ